MADLIISPGDRISYRNRFDGTERRGTALRLEAAGWRVLNYDRQFVVPVDRIVRVLKRALKKRPYRQLVLELDPGCRIDGPRFIGHYRTYSVYDSAGVEIGATDGNENDASFAWARAYGVLVKRGTI